MFIPEGTVLFSADAGPTLRWKIELQEWRFTATAPMVAKIIAPSASY